MKVKRPLSRSIKFGKAFINLLLILNLIAFFLLMFPSISQRWSKELDLFCNVSIIVFIVEIFFRIYYDCRKDKSFDFFGTINDPEWWNIFDVVVTAVSAITLFSVATDVVGVRTLRFLRYINFTRIISRWGKMRKTSNSIFIALNRITGIVFLFFFLYLFYAIIGVNFYQETDPEYFGSIGTAFYTLFQTMSLDNWSVVSSDVMKSHPRAWIFFASFIIMANYLLLNVIVAIFVDAMQRLNDKKHKADFEKLNERLENIEKTLKDIENAKENETFR